MVKVINGRSHETWSGKAQFRISTIQYSTYTKLSTKLSAERILLPFGTVIRNLCRNELLLSTGKLSTMYCPVFFALPDIKFQKGVFLSY